MSSVNIFQKAIYRKSLKWERFHCKIMSLREFERKLPRKTNCESTLYGIFVHQKRVVIFLERNCSLHFKLYERNQKKQLISRSVRTQFSGKMVKFKIANNKLWVTFRDIFSSLLQGDNLEFIYKIICNFMLRLLFQFALTVEIILAPQMWPLAANRKKVWINLAFE